MHQKRLKCCFCCYVFVKNSVGRVGALPNQNLSKNNLLEIGSEGGWSTLIWIMSFFFEVTPSCYHLLSMYSSYQYIQNRILTTKVKMLFLIRGLHSKLELLCSRFDQQTVHE